MANENKVSKVKTQKRSRTKKLFIRLGSVVVVMVAVVCLLALASNMASSALLSGPKPGFYLNGERRVRDGDPMVTVGDIEFSVLEYRFYYLTARDSFNEAYGVSDSYWADDEDGEKAAELKKLVEEELVFYAAWLQWADENGIALSNAEVEQIEKEMKAVKSQGKDAFNVQLASLHVADEDVFTLIRIRKATLIKAQAQYREEISKEYASSWKNKLLTVQQIYIAFEDEDDSVAKAEKSKLADEIFEMLENAKESRRKALFTSLQAEHSDDSRDEDGKLVQVQYTIYPSQQGVGNIYETALALEDGEVSAPIKTDYGYFILMRVEQDAEYISQNNATLKEAVLGSVEEEMVTKKEDAMVVVGGKYYGEVSLVTIK